MLGHLTWDPDPVAFIIPIVERPVVWYGLLFAIGFFFGYLVMRSLSRRYLMESGFDEPKARRNSTRFTDWVLWACVGGTLVGARLSHVFFYGWEYYSQHPMSILMVWEGGLSSHGGAIGVLLGLLIVARMGRRLIPGLTFLRLLDLVVVPVSLACLFIRLGNFVNQELVGTVTHVPWAVLFVHPTDGSPALPRHPVQLYESLSLLITFGVLFGVWRSSLRAKYLGLTSGLFFILVFGSRFFLEFSKAHVESLLDQGLALQMGQLLSIPFVIVGAGLLVMSVIWNRRRRDQWA